MLFSDPPKVPDRRPCGTGWFRPPELRVVAGAPTDDSGIRDIVPRPEERAVETTQTMSRRFVCSADELGNGESLTIKGDVPIALFRNDEGEFFATADTCTHEDWSLGEDSDLEGNEVVCPLHMARFDIRSGAALCFPASIALNTYDVEVDEDGKVYVIA
jgi:nitrite reductase/ring-hydroxylating ferredoxin subunit